MAINWWTLNTHKHIILLLLHTTTLQYFEKSVLLHTTEFLELLQKRTCDSIVNSYRNKTLIVLLLYLTSKPCFRSWSFTSTVRDGLVTVLVLNWRVLHDILHMKTLASYVLFISASLHYVSVHYMTCIWPKLNILDKKYQVFGHIDNAHSSYI